MMIFKMEDFFGGVFDGCSSLTSITIPNSVTSIGYGTFRGCTSLTSIIIPDSVTSIGYETFDGCTSLTSITIPSSVTSIGERAFENCSSLKNVTISDGVTSIGDYAFQGCTSLTSITIPSNVTSIGERAFENCSSLKNVTISDGVTSIGDYAFEDCSSLISITIPDSVTSIGERAFENCGNLTDITIPDSVILKNIFHGCKRLAMRSMIIIENRLYDYYGTRSTAKIPDGVMCIREYAFKGCDKLKDITIPNSVMSIGEEAFEDCYNLASITIPDSVTSIGNSAFEGCSSLTNITIPNSVIIIGVRAFENCGSLTSITIPDSVTSIGKGAFANCRNLKSIKLPKNMSGISLNAILDEPITIHIEDITPLSAKFRPGAAVGFAEDGRDCTDENGKAYIKYIRSNAAKLADLAIAHPALLYLMIHEKLIAAKDMDAVLEAVQKSGNTEAIAAILEYSHSGVSEAEQKKFRIKKEKRDTNVMDFFFSADRLEHINGKSFAVAGKLKTFASHDELRECLENANAKLTENLTDGVDYLITNTPNSGTIKIKKATELGIRIITEEEFNRMIGRNTGNRIE